MTPEVSIGTGSTLRT